MWYSEELGDWAEPQPAQSATRPVRSSLYQIQQSTHQRPVYQLRIIRCGTIIAFGV